MESILYKRFPNILDIYIEFRKILDIYIEFLFLKVVLETFTTIHTLFVKLAYLNHYPKYNWH